MYIGLHVKYPLFLSDFYETWIFSTYFRKITQIPHFTQIRPVGAQWRTDSRDKTNRRSSQFCEHV